MNPTFGSIICFSSIADALCAPQRRETRVQNPVLLHLGLVAFSESGIWSNRFGDADNLLDRFREALVFANSNSRQNGCAEAYSFGTLHQMNRTVCQRSPQLHSETRAAAAAVCVNFHGGRLWSQEFGRACEFTSDAFQDALVEIRSVRGRTNARDYSGGARVEVRITSAQQVWSDA